MSYQVVEQDIREVVAEIGQQLRMRTKISDRVHGKVHGRLPTATASEVLDQLAALYEFDWYCNNGVIFVTARSEAGVKMLPLGQVRFEDLSAALADLGITDARWTVRVSDRGVAMASGPPDYLALVEETYGALAKRSREAEVRVFRGSAAGGP